MKEASFIFCLVWRLLKKRSLSVSASLQTRLYGIMTLTPLVYWAQRHEEIYLRVELTDAQVSWLVSRRGSLWRSTCALLSEKCVRSTEGWENDCRYTAKLLLILFFNCLLGVVHSIDVCLFTLQNAVSSSWFVSFCRISTSTCRKKCFTLEVTYFQCPFIQEHIVKIQNLQHPLCYRVCSPGARSKRTQWIPVQPGVSFTSKTGGARCF